jgi:prolyl oligopeptidase
MRGLRYPETPSGSDVDRVAGITFSDPYRWLEEESEDVRRWQAVQGRIACEYIRSWPKCAGVARSVSKYAVDRLGALPRFIAGRWFHAIQATETVKPHILVSDTPYGAGHTIPICASGVDSAKVVISWISPSPDGCLLALGICADGSERNRIHLIELPAGATLLNSPPQLLMDAWMGGVCWLPDSSGFYFLALRGDPSTFRQVVLFHHLATGTQTQEDIPLPDPDSADYTLVSVSPDERYLIATHGLFAPRPVALRDLSNPNQGWQPFIRQAAGTIVGTIVDSRFVALTDIGAPRGRIIAIPLEAKSPDDPSQWMELLPESSVVLRSITPARQHFYITGFSDTYSKLLLADRECQALDEISLPGRGAIEEPLFPLLNLVPRGHPAEFHFAFSSPSESWGVFRHNPNTGAVETVRPPEVRFENAIVEDHWATSGDGTRVPYHTVRLANSATNSPAPALLYAYGAFNLPLVPEYPGAMAAFVAAGGVYIHCHIRGGAELGREWWHAGRMQNKQNCYQDLYAIAGDVVAKQLADPFRLAVTGRSNGGLMALVAAAQRPELWRAVVAQVPVADLIGVLRNPYGYYAVSSEYADPTDATEVMRLSAFSPYHLIKDGVAYPTTLIQAGAADPRCPPWHARKIAARMQQASVRNKPPILLRVRETAGHGLADRKQDRFDTAIEWLAFVMRELQLDPE